MITDMEIFKEYGQRLGSLGWHLTELYYEEEGICHYTYVAEHPEQGQVSHGFCLPHKELRSFLTPDFARDTVNKSQRMTLDLVCEIIES